MTCIFSFKKEAEVYIVFKGIQYNIDISEITFSQTFLEYTYSNKTIQTPNMFEQSVINKANPANFEFTLPVLQENDLQTVFNRALDYETFDLYIKTPQDTFKLATSVISNLELITERLKPLSIHVSGEAVRLTRFTDTIPGVVEPRSATRTYNNIDYLRIDIDNIDLDGIYNLSVSLQNEINWTNYTTVEGALLASNADNSIYPENFTVSKRILSGTINQYLTTENNSKLMQWSTNSPLSIQIGKQIGATFYGIELDLANCSFTNRLNTGEVFVQSYDWRMLQNPTSLLEVLRYIGITDAILDSLGASVLDSNNESILESV
jgi:hypothetical protein